VKIIRANLSARQYTHISVNTPVLLALKDVFDLVLSPLDDTPQMAVLENRDFDGVKLFIGGLLVTLPSHRFCTRLHIWDPITCGLLFARLLRTIRNSFSAATA